MKAALLLFFLTLATATCLGQKPLKLPVPIPEEALPPPPKEKPFKYKPPKMSVKERLDHYFLGRELKPWFIVNNLDWDRDTSDTTVGGHRIKWTSSYKEETKVDIDGDLFSLEGKFSLNKLDEVESDEGREVDFANRWSQIKLYDLDGRQLIGISMGSHPCTGTGCGVTFFLVYDLKTKSKSFFGSYRIDHEVKLYDFGNDGTIDFLSGTYSGGSDGIAKEISNIHELYTMDENGNFKPRSDKDGKKYFFKKTFKEKNYKELDTRFIHNWIEEIK
jgi:hypothetical protein